MREQDSKFHTEDWKEIELEIIPESKTPKKHDDGICKFRSKLTLSVILPRRGWTLIKKARNYVYLKPPQGQTIPFTIKIKIPSKEQALVIANSCFEAGESWMGQLGEWPAWYMHKHQSSSYLIERDNMTGEMVQKLDRTFELGSWLHIGEESVWCAKLEKKDKEFSYTSSRNLKDIESTISIPTIILEGKELQVEQNIYERNPLSRQKCLEHYGFKCQICLFDFAQTFGSIGQGFIHVHHITPISSRGGEYQVNPLKDLIPLCPNCHAMVHRRNPPYSIEELKTIYQSNMNSNENCLM